jgi:hypothetical protein
MGQVVIDIPQKVFRTYSVDDPEFGEKLLLDLKPYSKAGVISPRRKKRNEPLEHVLGIWSDRNETAQQIAKRIRENNRKQT